MARSPQQLQGYDPTGNRAEERQCCVVRTLGCSAQIPDRNRHFAREEHTAGPFVHTPAYCYDPDDPNFGFDEFDDQTCLGGGDWGDFVDDSGG